MVKIMAKKYGNCPCRNCRKVQEGRKNHPFIVWHKEEGEKRGHLEPVCSIECANEYAKRFK